MFAAGHSQTRREFLQAGALLGAAALVGKVHGQPEQRLATDQRPWFSRIVRWGQTNITEIDPERYDIGWWRRYWKQTRTQGVIINAGGIVAYYRTQVPLHRQAERLRGRDLFGELSRAAHEDGLVVLARMDSNRAGEELYRAQPDWFAVDLNGKPYRAGELYVTCINGPYYRQHIPAILREIISAYRPEGFADNSWSGLGRGSPCFCENCQQEFKASTGQTIPKERNWDDPLFRRWIEWNYHRRIEIWDTNNAVTKGVGGADCIWVGMNSGSLAGQCDSFRDYRAICQRAELILLDHQARNDAAGFQQNGDTGKLIHGLLGWDKLVPESMALYQAGRPTFRLASKPGPEFRLWMLEGIAGGIQPWWHHVGAYHEDRRMYHTIEPLNRWHEANQQYLSDRRPIANVGVVWSQQNYDYYGRDEADLLVEQPWRGMVQALIRARIPYLPVHADDLEREGRRFSTLVLPNLALMTDSQVTAIRRFVEGGGNLVATGQSSRFDGEGQLRPDFALADLLGVHWRAGGERQDPSERRKSLSQTVHSYLRLNPELRSQMDGPHIPSEPAAATARHPVLKGFELTDLIPFGGGLEPLEVDSRAQVLMTFVPPFPIYPPETAWMRQPKTSIPGLIVQTLASGSRVAFLPADLDRRFMRDNLPDHGNLLANVVRWASREVLPLSVEGHGLIDCHLYRQPGRVILHLVNLTNAGTWRQPVDELISVGPFRVRLKLPESPATKRVRLLVSNQKLTGTFRNGWCAFSVPGVLDHEVVVVG